MSDTSIATREPGISHKNIIEYAVTPEEARQALELATALAETHDSPQNPALFIDLELAACDLPENIRRAILEARSGQGVGALVLRGFSVEDEWLGRTPEGWAQADTPGSRVPAFHTLLLGALLGDCIGWEAQQQGRTVTDIVPSPSMEDSLVSSSSSRELTWHTEDAFSPYRADWVGLFCLRNPSRVPTTITGVRLDQVPDEVREILAQERFIVLPDSAHEMASRQEHEQPVAVLTSEAAGSVLRVDRDFMSAQPGDEGAGRALAWLTAELDENLTDVLLTPGDAGFINNRAVAHGRRAFTPDYQGNERWLKRVNVVRDIRVSRSMRAKHDSRSILSSQRVTDS